MKYLAIITSLFTLTALAQDLLEPIQVVNHEDESAAEHYGHSSTKLHTRELKKRREVSLGDTLKNEAGVNSNSFGPNAGRPVIRGLDGDRIRILQNGLGVLDASAQSADHAVPVDTLIVDNIEIVRGPMALLYGSSAVGGIINVNTNRIHSHMEEGTIREVQIQGDSATNGLSTGAKLDHGKNNWMVHVDAAYRNTNDQAIPGEKRSQRLRNRRPDPSLDKRGKLPNSMGVQKSAAVGVSRIFEKGHVGASYYRLDNYYGTVAEENVKIKMKQDRIEAHAEYRPGLHVLKAVKLKSAQSDYRHNELDEGEVASTFGNEGNESRLEFLTRTGDVHGVTGLQSQIFNFKAVGEEAFLPPTQNRILSGFTLQEVTKGRNTYSFGARTEEAHVHNKDNGTARNFAGTSGAGGILHKLSNEFSTSLNLSYTERAPTFQELFAEGPHVATGIYERGSDSFTKEQAQGVDLGLKYRSSKTNVSFNLYRQEFKNFILLSPTLDFEDGLPVNTYGQVDAFIHGYDLEISEKLGSSPFTAVVKSDYVRGKNKEDGKDLPRLSPARVSLGIEKQIDRWSWDVEAQYNFEQTKTAPGELATDDFVLLNAGIGHDLQMGVQNLSSFVRLKNLLNQEARIHTSSLKDIAPLPGRSLVAGVQYLF